MSLLLIVCQRFGIISPFSYKYYLVKALLMVLVTLLKDEKIPRLESTTTNGSLKYKIRSVVVITKNEFINLNAHMGI